MSRTRPPGHTTGHPIAHGHRRVHPARSPGHLGINDHADPNVRAAGGDTPGPAGVGDHPPPGSPVAPGASAGRPSAWLQLGGILDQPEGTVSFDPALNSVLPPRNPNGQLIERFTPAQVEQAEAELRGAAERMAQFSAMVARNPDRYEPVHSAEPGHPAIGYWWVMGGTAGADYLAADVRILFDVQGREVTREVGGVEPSVLQADDFIPFGMVAGLSRRAVTTGGRLAGRAVAGLATRAVCRTVFDRLRQAVTQAVGRTARAAATSPFEQAGERIGARLRDIGRRLDDIVRDSAASRPGTSGITPEQQIDRVVQSVEHDADRILRLRRTPVADGAPTIPLDGLNPQQLASLADSHRRRAERLIARARADLPQVVRGPQGQVGVIEAGGPRTRIPPTR